MSTGNRQGDGSQRIHSQSASNILEELENGPNHTVQHHAEPHNFTTATVVVRVKLDNFTNQPDPLDSERVGAGGAGGGGGRTRP